MRCDDHQSFYLLDASVAWQVIIQLRRKRCGFDSRARTNVYMVCKDLLHS